MTLELRWRVPDRRVSLRWRGSAGMLAALERSTGQPLAAIVGPPGPAGPQGPAGVGSAPLRFNASLGATWTFSHALGRVPTVQVYLADGEAVLTDLVATTTQITVTFPSPQQGFVLAF